MNRETKRMLQRQGQLSEDGAPKATRRPAPSPNAPREPRTKPREFAREDKAEMRKVAWPTRQETISLSIVVFVFLVILTALIAVLDFGFSKGVLWIVNQ